MYCQIQFESITSDSIAAEELADTFYEIGKEEYNKKHYEVAARWLERACNVLSEQGLDILSDSAPDLKMSALHLLTKSLLALQSPDSTAKARDIVQLMDTEYGDKMLVCLLKLEILMSESQPDVKVYQGILTRLFRNVYLSKSNFKTLMHHIHHLRKLSPEVACECLGQLLSLRLFHGEKLDLVERVFVMRVWITTSNAQITSLMDSLESFLDLVSRNVTAPFSSAATHASQTLLWKVVEGCFNQRQFDQAQRFCQLCNHVLFSKCGESNKAKISRKIIQCAIARQNWNDARQAYFSMSDMAQKASLSRLLLYKVAIHTEDEQLGKFSLGLCVLL